MDVSLLTTKVDGKGLLNTISIDQATPIQNAVRQEDAYNGDNIDPSLNGAPSITPSREDLQQKLPTDTEYVADRIKAHEHTPIITKYRV